MSYKVKDGKMPEEFHVKHLINESRRVIEIKCNQCDKQESVDGDGLDLSEPDALERYAARCFYASGWRYCSLPDYEIEGIFCIDCIHDDGGTEDNTLQQPREKTHE